MHSIFKPISQFLWTILLDFLQILVRRKVPMPTVHRPSLKRNWISSHLIIIFFIYKEFTLNKKTQSRSLPTDVFIMFWFRYNCNYSGAWRASCETNDVFRQSGSIYQAVPNTFPVILWKQNWFIPHPPIILQHDIL